MIGLYIALLIAPDGHVTEIRNLSITACVRVVQAYRMEVSGGKGSCIQVGDHER